MQAAEAVIRVANSKMAGAIRLVSIERGHNPNEFAGMPFGGGGALHAGALMKDVGLKNALVPRFPGVTSALGCTIADMRHDFVQTLNGVLGDLNVTQLDSQMTGLAGKGLNLLEEAGVSFGGIDTVFELDMSYMGQTHTVDVALPIIYEGGATGVSEEDIREAFEARYRQVYGRPLDGIAIRVLNLRVSVIGRRPKFDLSLLAPKGDASLESSHLGTRQVWVDGAWHEANIYERLPLPVGTIIPGPALLEQPDTTIFIEPDLTGLVDDFGNIVISRKPEA